MNLRSPLGSSSLKVRSSIILPSSSLRISFSTVPISIQMSLGNNIVTIKKILHTMVNIIPGEFPWLICHPQIVPSNAIKPPTRGPKVAPTQYTPSSNTNIAPRSSTSVCRYSYLAKNNCNTATGTQSTHQSAKQREKF